MAICFESVYLYSQPHRKKTIQWRTPYQLVWKKTPDISHLRIFGSQGHALRGTAKTKKLKPCGVHVLFFGHGNQYRGYEVWYNDTIAVGFCQQTSMNFTENDNQLQSIYISKQTKTEMILKDMIGIPDNSSNTSTNNESNEDDNMKLLTEFEPLDMNKISDQNNQMSQNIEHPTKVSIGRGE